MPHVLKFAPLAAGISQRASRSAPTRHLASRGSCSDASVAGVRPHDPRDEMTGYSEIAAARRRERARCAAIFATKAAGANPALAAHLAFNTTLTRSEAIRALKTAPAAATWASRHDTPAAHAKKARKTAFVSVLAAAMNPHSVRAAESSAPAGKGIRGATRRESTPAERLATVLAATGSRRQRSGGTGR